MVDEQDYRPETLPQQVRRLAADGYARLKALPPWWGVALWIAICLALQVSMWSLRRMVSTTAVGDLLRYYTSVLAMAPVAGLRATLLPLCGLLPVLGRTGATWKVPLGFSVVALHAALSQAIHPLVSVLYLVMPYLGWIAIGLVIRQHSKTIINAVEPSLSLAPSRWTVRDMLMITTLVGVLTAGGGWWFRAFPIDNQINAGANAQMLSIGAVAYSATHSILWQLACLPVLAGVFPIEPRPVTRSRVAGYAGLSIVIGLLLGVVAMCVMLSQLPPGNWFNGGWWWLYSSISAFCNVGSLALLGLWLRWWGYRRWRLPSRAEHTTP